MTVLRYSIVTAKHQRRNFCPTIATTITEAPDSRRHQRQQQQLHQRQCSHYQRRREDWKTVLLQQQLQLQHQQFHHFSSKLLDNLDDAPVGKLSVEDNKNKNNDNKYQYYCNYNNKQIYPTKKNGVDDQDEKRCSNLSLGASVLGLIDDFSSSSSLMTKTSEAFLLATSSSDNAVNSDVVAAAATVPPLTSVYTPLFVIVTLASSVGAMRLLWKLRKEHKEAAAIAKADQETETPVSELYDDLYYDDDDVGDDKKKRKKNAVRQTLDFFRNRQRDAMKARQTAAERRNPGKPLEGEFLTLKHWNQKLDSLQYSVSAAVQSVATAAAQNREHNFDRAWRQALSSQQTNTTTTTTTTNSTTTTPAATTTLLSPHTKSKLIQLEKDFLKAGSKLVARTQRLQTRLTETIIDSEMDEMGVQPFEMDPPPALAISSDSDDKKNNKTEAAAAKVTVKELLAKKRKQNKRYSDSKQWLTELANTQNQLMALELQFIKDVVKAMGSNYAAGIQVALVGDIPTRGSGGILTQLQQRPLMTVVSALEQARIVTKDEQQEQQKSVSSDLASPQNDMDTVDDGSNNMQNNVQSAAAVTTEAQQQQPGTLFVTKFFGDLMASQVSVFREEVTAIVRNARKGIDEVVVILKSPGGTVTGYGLAAGQLLRLKNSGIKVTVVVEEIAASGGYMMCCIADRIVGSPFAIFGSIGVVQNIPNFHSRLNTEGVDFVQVAAGNYKDGISPFKEVTEAAQEETNEQLESIMRTFKQHVQENRPQLAANMDDVIGTGEVWFGTDAVEIGLCDEIKTVEQVLTEYVDAGWDVFEVELKQPKHKGLLRLGTRDDNAEDATTNGYIAGALHWIARNLSSSTARTTH